MYQLWTDMFSDLPEDVCRDNDIGVAPATYILNGNTYTHSFESNHPEEFYSALRQGSMPETSQVNAEVFKQLFTPALEAGKDIIYIAFSSGLSGTYNSGRIAAEELREQFPARKILVVDSLSASLGQGLLVYKAAQKKKEGYDIDKLAVWAEANKLTVHHWFTVDNLFHLRRGGRISGAAAIMGTLLSIKPVLHMNDQGRLIPVVKMKGRKKSLLALADKMEELGIDLNGQDVFISHGDSLADAEFLRDVIAAKYPACRFTINFVGPVIGAHSGPGTIALFFTGKPR